MVGGCRWQTGFWVAFFFFLCNFLVNQGLIFIFKNLFNFYIHKALSFFMSGNYYFFCTICTLLSFEEQDSCRVNEMQGTEAVTVVMIFSGALIGDKNEVSLLDAW